MRIVIVGAGAVGAVVGVQLEHQKHEVIYLVRRGRKRELHELQLVSAKTGEVRRRDAPQVAELGDRLPPFEWALLAVRGDQLDEVIEVLRQHVRPDAKVAVASGRLDAVERVRAAHAGPVCNLMPTYSAWSEAPRVWRWFPAPLLKSMVSGEGDAAAQEAAVELAAALDAAGVPARAVASSRPYEPAMAAGVALLGGLELAGWDMEALARDGALRRETARAMREAAQAAGKASPGLPSWLLRHAPTGALSLVPRALPLLADEQVRSMWQHHGPKIAAQTRGVLDDLLARAGNRDLPHLRALRRRLDSAATEPAASQG